MFLAALALLIITYYFGIDKLGLWIAISFLYFLNAIQRESISTLENTVQKLQKQLYGGKFVQKEPAPSGPVVNSQALQNPQHSMPVQKSEPLQAEGKSPDLVKHTTPTPPRLNEKKETTESFLGQNLIVWLAGFAAILGAFYLIRYSIDHGILGPKVRFALMTLFGIFITFFGYYVYGRDGFANNKRIGQALIGSGLATLYFAAYAVSEIYHFTSQGVSLLWMCIVTGMAVILTIIRGGKPIALLTMLGTFLTPSLAGGEITSPCFFSIYMLLFMGIFAWMAVEMASVLILILAGVGLYLWGFYWLFFGVASFISLWQMFLLIGATAIFVQAISKIPSANSDVLRILSIVFCFIFGFGYVIKMSLGLMEWAVIGMMTLGLVLLTLKDVKNYLPLLAGSIIIGLIIWTCSDGEKLLPVFAGYAAVCLLPIYVALWFNHKPIFAAYTGVFSLLFYAVYCFVFHFGEADAFVGLCGAIALLLSLFRCKLDTVDMQEAAGLSILSAACLTVVALAKLIAADMLPVIAAAGVFTFAGLNKICRAKYMLFGWLATFGWFISLLLKPILFALGFLFAGQVFGLGIDTGDLSFANITCYGIIPMVLFGATMALLFKGEIRNIMFFSVCFLALGVLFSLYAKMVTPTYNSTYVPSFVAHAVLTDLLIAAYWLLLKGKSGSIVLSAIGFWRLGLVCLILLFKTSNLSIGYMGAVLCFGVPLGLFIWFAKLSKTEAPFLAKWAMVCSFYLATLFVTLNLSGGMTGKLFARHLSEGGLFAYSAGWMLLGICWLIAARYVRFMVKPAFAMIYFVIAKVFLYDVAELSDFWRIISLFALAGCLFTIGHFHARWCEPRKQN